MNEFLVFYFAIGCIIQPLAFLYSALEAGRVTYGEIWLAALTLPIWPVMGLGIVWLAYDK